MVARGDCRPLPDPASSRETLRTEQYSAPDAGATSAAQRLRRNVGRIAQNEDETEGYSIAACSEQLTS